MTKYTDNDLESLELYEKYVKTLAGRKERKGYPDMINIAKFHLLDDDQRFEAFLQTEMVQSDPKRDKVIERLKSKRKKVLDIWNKKEKEL